MILSDNPHNKVIRYGVSITHGITHSQPHSLLGTEPGLVALAHHELPHTDLPHIHCPLVQPV